MPFSAPRFCRFLTACLPGAFAATLLACDAPQQRQQPPRSYTQRLDALTAAYLRQPADSLTFHGTDSLVNRLTRVLRQTGIDTVLYYRRGCQGCGLLATPATRCMCNQYEMSSYLCWRYRGVTLAKKLDCCRSHAPVKAAAEVFDFYFRHQSAFDAGQRFYADLLRHNQAHPARPRFLPPTPIHDRFANIRLHLPQRRLEIEVRAGEYDSTGTPTRLPYEWKRKHGEWARLLERHLP
ncbi:hypothetical protein [Hymenobacter sp. B81]|uniref:hypothetical protein n=1 Tax=Hymenobacter sp. B81 TaxID=3344878 RepID=UPI0037DC659A